jgi:hypothetical protein
MGVGRGVAVSAAVGLGPIVAAALDLEVDELAVEQPKTATETITVTSPTPILLSSIELRRRASPGGLAGMPSWWVMTAEDCRQLFCAMLPLSFRLA